MTEEDARVKGLLPKGHKGPLKTIKKVFHAWELTCGRKKGHGKWKGEITRNMIRLYAGAVTKNGDIEEKKSHTRQHVRRTRQPQYNLPHPDPEPVPHPSRRATVIRAPRQTGVPT